MLTHTGDTIYAAQAKIEGPAVSGQCAKKIALRIGHVVRIDAGEAIQLGHGLEIGPQDVSHALVAEESTALRIDHPNAFRYGLD